MNRYLMLALVTAFALVSRGASLTENAVAITNAAAQIDAAIVAKGGSTTGGLLAAPDAIAALPSGGGSYGMNDIVFYDFDGTVVYSCSVNDLPIDDMPTPKNHSCLNFVGWTHSLGEVNGETDMLDVGAMYETKDGATHIHITIPQYASLTQEVRFTQSVANGVRLDWGDGIVETDDVVTNSFRLHVYETYGEKTIKLFVDEGTLSFAGTSSEGGIARGVSNLRIDSVEIGKGVTTLGSYAFGFVRDDVPVMFATNITSLTSGFVKDSRSPTHITFPSVGTTVSVGAYNSMNYVRTLVMPKKCSYNHQAFQNLNNLSRLVIPNGYRDNGGYNMFSGLYADRIHISTNMTYFAYGIFTGNNVIQHIKIPKNITSISTDCFKNNYRLQVVDFTDSTRVVSLDSTSVFQNCSCVFIVPDALYDSWVTASNWSSPTFANRIFKQSERR